MNFRLLSQYHADIKKLIKISLPILLAQIAQNSMGLADTIMAGRVSSTDMAAISVGASIWMPLVLFGQGLLLALPPTISYLNGSGQRHRIAHQVRQGIWIVLGVSIPLGLLIYFCEIPLQYMQMESKMSDLARDYLHAMLWGLPAYLMLINFRCLNDGIAKTKPAMVITFLGLLLNIPLNYIFIFGKFGLPEMGSVGCGIATAIVNWVMFLMMFYYCYTNKSQRDIGLFSKWIEMPSGQTLLKICKLGLPIGFATFTEVMLFSTSALFLSPLGAQVVASHQAALQTSSLFFMIPMSFSIATTIVIGQTLGQKHLDDAKVLSYHALLTGFMFACLAAVVIVLLDKYIPLAFTRDPLSISIAANLLLFAAVYQIPDALQAVANGVLRGYKHTKPILYVTIFCYWIVGMPLGYILARTELLVEPMAAQGFWLTFCISLSFASGLLIWQIRKIQKVPHEVLIQKLERIK